MGLPSHPFHRQAILRSPSHKSHRIGCLAGAAVSQHPDVGPVVSRRGHIFRFHIWLAHLPIPFFRSRRLCPRWTLCRQRPNSHAALAHFLDDARDEFLRPDPGRSLLPSRSVAGIATLGCGQFHAHAHHSIQRHRIRGLGTLRPLRRDLVADVRGCTRNRPASVDESRQRICRPDAYLRRAVPFREPRWARKALHYVDRTPCSGPLRQTRHL